MTYSLSNFQIRSTLLTTVTVMRVTSTGLVYLVTRSLYLLTTCTHFSHPSPLTFGNHQSVLCVNEFYFALFILLPHYLNFFHCPRTPGSLRMSDPSSHFSKSPPAYREGAGGGTLFPLQSQSLKTMEPQERRWSGQSEEVSEGAPEMGW